MKIINYKSELPSWFNLDSYKECENLSARDWLTQIIFRDVLISRLCGFWQELDFYFHFEPSELAIQMLDTIKQTPIINISKINEQIKQLIHETHPKGFDVTFEIEDYIKYSKSCSKLTPQSIATIYNHYDEMEPIGFLSKQKELLKTRKEKKNEYLNEIKQLDETMPKWFRKPVLENSSSLFLRIDLTANKKVLLDEFEHIIDSNLKNIQNYTEPTYKKWHRYKLLPYIDLITWARLNNIKIKHDVLQQKFYPHGEKSKDSFIKTVKSSCSSIFDAYHCLHIDEEPYYLELTETTERLARMAINEH